MDKLVLKPGMVHKLLSVFRKKQYRQVSLPVVVELYVGVISIVTKEIISWECRTIKIKAGW